MIYPIYLYGSQVLREVAEEADLSQKEELTKLIGDMIETMHHADGCGLAAPQIGISKRILVVDGDELSDRFPALKGFHREMINPVFTFESEETSEYSEGCLSIPNVDADIVRPAKIKVRYFNADFQEVEEEFDEFAARMVQHEMDHLNGIVFTDRATPIRKKLLAGKLFNISRGKTNPAYRVKTDKR
ncbi:MAG: peptide deformylase [Bacteroidales bacterium]|nr:peptide deformylase [Bacteroidales bacterium]MBR5056702.1 peptide deformylase [Bacteroidales bacterium]